MTAAKQDKPSDSQKKGQCNQPEKDSDIGVKCDMCVSGSLRSDLRRLKLRCEQ